MASYDHVTDRISVLKAEMDQWLVIATALHDSPRIAAWAPLHRARPRRSRRCWSEGESRTYTGRSHRAPPAPVTAVAQRRVRWAGGAEHRTADACPRSQRG